MKGINENGGFEWTVHPSDVEVEIKERDLEKSISENFSNLPTIPRLVW